MSLKILMTYNCIPISKAGSSEHWITVTLRVWLLKSYSTWNRKWHWQWVRETGNWHWIDDFEKTPKTVKQPGYIKRKSLHQKWQSVSKKLALDALPCYGLWLSSKLGHGYRMAGGSVKSKKASIIHREGIDYLVLQLSQVFLWSGRFCHLLLDINLFLVFHKNFFILYLNNDIIINLRHSQSNL